MKQPRINDAKKKRKTTAAKSPCIAPIEQPERFADQLLDWYDQGHRLLPFRLDPSPYKIWISEIMAQQTRMEALLPYYERFLAKYPNMAALAQADMDELMKVWQGLGYYDRARRMHACAQRCMEQYDGQLPSTYEALQTLPGIGPYVAGAVASIAFGQKVPAVDGNVIRVFSRITALQENTTPAAMQKQIRLRMEAVMPARPGDFNQALMELGALVCLPKSPKCGICPVQTLCRAHQLGMEEQLPIKAKKKPRPVEKKQIYIWAARDGSHIHFNQRPQQGLLAGLYEFDEQLPDAQTLAQAGLQGPEKILPLEGHRHIFTHKEWDMEGTLVLCEPVSGSTIKEQGTGTGIWVSLEQSKDMAIPSAFAPFYQQAVSLLECGVKDCGNGDPAGREHSARPEMILADRKDAAWKKTGSR